MLTIQIILRIYLICLLEHDILHLLYLYQDCEHYGTEAQYSLRVFIWALLFCMPLEGTDVISTMAQVMWIIWHIGLVIEMIVDAKKNHMKLVFPKRAAIETTARGIVSLLVIAAVIYVRLHCTAESFTGMTDVVSTNMHITTILMIVICVINTKLHNAK